MTQNGNLQNRIGNLTGDKNGLSAFRPVRSRKQTCPQLLPVLLGRQNSQHEYNIHDNPLAALEGFVTNYFCRESALEPNEVLLSKQRRSLTHKPRQESLPKKSVFTDIQIQTLEESFQFKQHLSPKSREWLAKLVGLTKRQVITWFQNRRARERKKAGVKMAKHGKKCVAKGFKIPEVHYQVYRAFRWEKQQKFFDKCTNSVQSVLSILWRNAFSFVAVWPCLRTRGLAWPATSILE